MSKYYALRVHSNTPLRFTEGKAYEVFPEAVGKSTTKWFIRDNNGDKASIALGNASYWLIITNEQIQQALDLHRRHSMTTLSYPRAHHSPAETYSDLCSRILGRTTHDKIVRLTADQFYDILSPTEEPISMNQKIATNANLPTAGSPLVIKSVVLINDRNSDSVSTDEILQFIGIQQGILQYLDTLQLTSSSAVKRLAEKHQANIDSLVSILDKRESLSLDFE